ncbi:hypothetical protein OK016_04940 [Vibrio chagasii]|nr:hypothetical protein [Vibrio chagasii]
MSKSCAIERGIKLELSNQNMPLSMVFKIIKGIQRHYSQCVTLCTSIPGRQPKQPDQCYSYHQPSVWYFKKCRRALTPGHRTEPHRVLGGHSINAESEYQYTREVGNELGLRELNICTGCGPGALKAMKEKGAAVVTR